jgi:uncharacterized protein
LPNIAVDAGPLIALFRESDRYHKTAMTFLERTEGSTLVTNLLVVGEVAAILGKRHADLVAALNWVVDNIEIDQHAGSDLAAAIEIVQKYKDLPADLADVSLVALCERHGINTVASVDRDFDVYRLSRNRKFQNVFFETT